MLKSIHEDVLYTHHVSSLIYNFKHQCGYISRTNLKLKAKMDQYVTAMICRGHYVNLHMLVNTTESVIAEHIKGNSI